MQIASSDAIDGWADVITFMQTEDPRYYKMEIAETADDPPRIHTVTPAIIALGMERIIALEMDPPVPGNAITTLSQIREWIMVSIKDDDAVMIDDYCANAIVQYGLFNNTPYS
jgi:hypothetical protein